MKKKITGYQCPKCEKTHEVCSLSNCVNRDISRYVCWVFGINPLKLARRKRL